MQKKFGIVVVAAIQDQLAKVAQPRPGVRMSSRRRLGPKLPTAVAA